MSDPEITNLKDYVRPRRAAPGGKLAYSIAELAEASSVGRTGIYSAIKSGELRCRKIGRRSVILLEDARAWLTGGRENVA